MCQPGMCGLPEEMSVDLPGLRTSKSDWLFWFSRCQSEVTLQHFNELHHALQILVSLNKPEPLGLGMLAVTYQDCIAHRVTSHPHRGFIAVIEDHHSGLLGCSLFLGINQRIHLFVSDRLGNSYF